ncbi:MAG: choice-of-anchor E domain-containing protein [Planctomycetes bacterium]|nr:choice-of-anchor E domain-containing protein [Planctomycetota bacterium]MCB9904964.1 choice-of-anchor E domain-containing protein [Planctomycetota bacterium]
MNATKLFRYGTMCFALLLAGTAQAETQIISHKLSTALKTDKPNSPESDTIVVPGFDSSLGTLVNVWVRLDSHVEGAWAVENTVEKERFTKVGGAGQVTATIGSDRELIRCTARDQVQAALSGFDNILDFRGSSAANGTFAGDKSTELKFAPDVFWIKTSDPDGVPFSVDLMGSTTQPSETESLLLVDAVVSVHVIYSYVPVKSAVAPEQSVEAPESPGTIHAWLEEREDSSD